MIDFESFVIGFVSCVVFNALFGIISYVFERAFYYRDLRKNKDDYIK